MNCKTPLIIFRV